MNAAAASAITSTELRELFDSPTPPRVLDVRTPGEFETAHIAGSYNVPLDVVRHHRDEIVKRIDSDTDLVLVCRTGQRASQAQAELREAGLTNGRVLENGLVDWQNSGFAVNRGKQRWDLERQVRLVAGSVVLSSVLGSIAIPRLKWAAAAIGGGLTFAALTNTCAMATALSKLPYNRKNGAHAATILSDDDLR